jgi:hypothetical protein
MDHYDKILEILDIPYFKNLISMGIDTVHYGEIFKRMYNDTITINNREIINEIGKVIYYENSDGEWYKKEYDDNNNLIFTKQIGGYWLRKEYDDKGKLIYYEDSNGISEHIELESENKLK